MHARTAHTIILACARQRSADLRLRLQASKRRGAPVESRTPARENMLERMQAVERWLASAIVAGFGQRQIDDELVGLLAGMVLDDPLCRREVFAWLGEFFPAVKLPADCGTLEMLQTCLTLP